MKKFLATIVFAALVSPALATTKDEVMSHYADLAQAKYQDSLTAARDLQKAVDALVAKPTQGELGRRPRGVDGVARALPAERGLPLRQRDGRRLGGQGERLAARRGG